MGLETTGLDQLVRRMEKVGKITAEIEREMLEAGAAKVVEAWQQSARTYKHVKTGAMVRSIKAHDAASRSTGAQRVEIYPHGADKKKVRNMAKAAYLHYGVKKRKGDRWVDRANEAGEAAAIAAMEQVLDEKLRKAGL